MHGPARCKVSTLASAKQGTPTRQSKADGMVSAVMATHTERGSPDKTGTGQEHTPVASTGAARLSTRSAETRSVPPNRISIVTPITLFVMVPTAEVLSTAYQDTL